MNRVGRIVGTIALALLSFGGGTFLGYSVAKKKYEMLADEEVASVKEALTKHYTQSSTTEPSQAEKVVDKKAVEESKPVEITEQEAKQYYDYSKQYRTPEVNNKMVDKGPSGFYGKGNPYVVSEKDFSDSDYNAKSLHYWADGTVTDDEGELINNIVEVIGEEAIAHINEYESDCVFVRNDALQVDYELIIESKPYNKSYKGLYGSDKDDD